MEEDLTRLKIKELHHTPRGLQMIKTLVQLRCKVHKKERQLEVNRKRKEIIEYLENLNNGKTLLEKRKDVLHQLLLTTVCYDFIPEQEIVDRNNIVQKKYCILFQVDKRMTAWLTSNGHRYIDMPKLDINCFNPNLIQHHEWTDMQYKYFRKIYNYFFEYVKRKSMTIEKLLPKEDQQ